MRRYRRYWRRSLSQDSKFQEKSIEINLLAILINFFCISFQGSTRPYSLDGTRAIYNETPKGSNLASKKDLGDETTEPGDSQHETNLSEISEGSRFSYGNKVTFSRYTSLISEINK